MTTIYTTNECNESKRNIYASFPNCILDLAHLINQYVALDIEYLSNGTKLWSAYGNEYFVITKSTIFSIGVWNNSNLEDINLFSDWYASYCDSCLSPFAGAHGQHCPIKVAQIWRTYVNRCRADFFTD